VRGHERDPLSHEFRYRVFAEAAAEGVLPPQLDSAADWCSLAPAVPYDPNVTARAGRYALMRPPVALYVPAIAGI
jgi:hypothetical protein